MAGLPFAVIPLAFTIAAERNTVAGFPASNLAHFRYAGLVWKTSSSGQSTYLDIDLGASKKFDFLSIRGISAAAAASFPLNAQCGTTIGGSQAGTISVAFDAPARAGAPGTLDSYSSFTEKTARYIRVNFPSTAFSVTTIVIGSKLSIARFYEPRWTSGFEDLGSLDMNRFGIPGGEDGVKLPFHAYTLQWTSELEYEAKWRPFYQAIGPKDPALYCFDSDASPLRMGRTYFGWNRAASEAQKVAPDRFNQQFDIIGQQMCYPQI